MSLTPEQKQAVAGWVAAGDNLSAVQKKLIAQFQLSMTYRDVRFLVDDLNLELKDPAPKVDTTDVSKTAPSRARPEPVERAPEKKGFIDKAKDETQADIAEEDLAAAPGASNVSVSVDKVTLIPGALASGTVTFSDGVTGKWIVDQHGRPGFTEVSVPNYRPSPADGQAFMQELSRSLQQRGF